MNNQQPTHVNQAINSARVMGKPNSGVIQPQVISTPRTPKGSAMDQVDLFVKLMESPTDSIAVADAHTLINQVMAYHPTKLTLRKEEVVFIRSPNSYGLLISLPEGTEINLYGPTNVSAVLMSVVSSGGTQDELIALAGAIDAIVEDLRGYETNASQDNNEE